MADDFSLELHRDGHAALVVPETRARVQCGTGIIAILAEVGRANRGGQPAGIAELVRSPEQAAATAWLLTLGVLAEQRPEKMTRPTGLSPLEWGVLRISQAGGCFRPGLSDGAHAPPRFLGRRGTGPSISLPVATPPPPADLWNVIDRRRSRHTGPERTLSLEQVGTLLAFTDRIQLAEQDTFGEISFRPVASGGARHPIDVYLAAPRVRELDGCLYQYDPERHALIPLGRSMAEAAALVRNACTALAVPPQAQPALTFFLVAVPERTTCKYDDFGLVTVMKDVGCLIQQLYLVVEGIGLHGCAIGGCDATTVEHVLGLRNADEAFIGGFLVW